MAAGPTRLEVVRGFLPQSPFPTELGMELVEIEPGRVVLRLPWRPELATIADVVHGGAIATLLDTAGMAAAWADDETVPETIGGATVAMSISYMAAARATDLVAVGEVVRRGSSLCFVDVTVTAGDDVVAKGMVTHRYG